MEFTTKFELQSQATRLIKGIYKTHKIQARTGVSPSLLLFSKRLNPDMRSIDLRPQFGAPDARSGSTDYHNELIPVHSPLLREYQLVSFPPLNYMLKFSG